MPAKQGVPPRMFGLVRMGFTGGLYRNGAGRTSAECWVRAGGGGLSLLLGVWFGPDLAGLGVDDESSPADGNGEAAVGERVGLRGRAARVEVEPADVGVVDVAGADAEAAARPLGRDLEERDGGVDGDDGGVAGEEVAGRSLVGPPFVEVALCLAAELVERDVAAARGVVQAAVRALDKVGRFGLVDGGADAGCDPGGVELFVGGGEAGAVGAAGGEDAGGGTEGDVHGVGS